MYPALRPVALSVLAAAAVVGQVQQPSPKESPAATPLRYAIEAELLPDERTVVGTQTMHWRNPGRHAVGELHFHLYLNAFRDADSTFMREAGKAFRQQWRPTDFGGIEVTSVRLGADATELARAFVQPDDQNRSDATVMRVTLPAGVAPGDEVEVRMSFTCRLPKALRRVGWMPGDTFFLMHWHPILGVLQEHDGKPVWNCHQFHAHTEFFADFAEFDVALTAPEAFVIGATGGLAQDSRALGDGRRSHRFRQDRVHNFAFVASPHFVVVDDRFGPLRAAEDRTGVAPRVAQKLGVPVETFDLPETRIRLLLRREHDTTEQRARHLAAIKVGLEFYGLRFGAYPYPMITAVDPGRDLEGRVLGGGMEYAMLITCGTNLLPHARELAPESVTVHEFGHQFWYGLSANNEFEESWLDEGLNSYSDGRALRLGYASSLQSASGREMTAGEVTRFGLLPFALHRGGHLRDGTLTLRPDLPAVWRIPGYHYAEALRFDARWQPRSPLLDLLGRQPLAAWHAAPVFDEALRDRDRFVTSRTSDPMVMPGWRYRDHASYIANSYSRPATLLHTLENLATQRDADAWWTFLREFHLSARFQHPTTAQFRTMLAERCGEPLAAWFDRAIVAGATFDYGILGEPEQADGRTVVTIARHGMLTGDVTVRCRFANVEVPEFRRLRGDDLAAVHRLEFVDETDKPRGELLEVWIDPPVVRGEARVWPFGEYLVDEDVTNNAWQRQAVRGPARHRGLRAWLQAVAELSFLQWFS